MAFTLRIGSISTFTARLEAARAAVGPALEIGMTELATQAVDLLHEASPYDSAPDNGTIPGEEGHLNDSFVADPVTGFEENAVTFIRTTEPIKYGYVTNGTASPIVPTVKKAMWWPDAPHPMLSVSGQKANPFAEEVGNELLTMGDVLFAPTIAAIAAAIGGA